MLNNALLSLVLKGLLRNDFEQVGVLVDHVVFVLEQVLDVVRHADGASLVPEVRSSPPRILVTQVQTGLGMR